MHKLTSDLATDLGSERAQELIDEICRKYEGGGGGQARILQMGANGLPASMGNLAFVAPGAGAPPPGVGGGGGGAPPSTSRSLPSWLSLSSARAGR